MKEDKEEPAASKKPRLDLLDMQLSSSTTNTSVLDIITASGSRLALAEHMEWMTEHMEWMTVEVDLFFWQLLKL